MKRDYSKIFGLVLLIVISSTIVYLALFTYNKKGREEIKMINLHGNSLLSSDIYLRYAGLDEDGIYDDLTLNIIKKRIEKHPYVAKAEVKYDGTGRVDISIKEKDIYAVLLASNEPHFISSDFELIKIYEYTSYQELPLVSNIRLHEKITPQKILKNEDIIEAFKIIDAARITDIELTKKLVEINLKNGGEVVLTFSGVKYPVLFGRGNEAKKMIYLSLIWENLNNNGQELVNVNYIDLRFSNQAFIGKNENTDLM